MSLVRSKGMPKPGENKELDFNCDPQQLQQYVLNAVNRISEQKINNQSITLFLGPTRSGKSTLITFLLGNKIKKTKISIGKEVDKLYLPENYEMLQRQHKIPEIGLTALSCTLFPEAFIVPAQTNQPPIAAIDTGGFADNRSDEKGVAVAIATRYAVKSAQSINGIVFVIDYRAIDVQGGTLMRDLAAVIKNILISKEHQTIHDIQKSILFVFTFVPSEEDEPVEEIVLRGIKRAKQVRDNEIQRLKVDLSKSRTEEDLEKLKQKLQEKYDELPVWEALLEEDGKNFVALTSSKGQIEEEHRKRILTRIAEFKAFPTNRILFDVHDEHSSAFAKFVTHKTSQTIELLDQLNGFKASQESLVCELKSLEKSKEDIVKELAEKKDSIASKSSSKESLNDKIKALSAKLNRPSGSEGIVLGSELRKNILELQIKKLESDKARYDTDEKIVLWSRPYFEKYSYLTTTSRTFAYKGIPYDDYKDVELKINNLKSLPKDYQAWSGERTNPVQGIYEVTYKPSRGVDIDITLKITRIKRNLPEHQKRIMQIDALLLQKHKELGKLKDHIIKEQKKENDNREALQRDLSKIKYDATGKEKLLEAEEKYYKNKEEEKVKFDERIASIKQDLDRIQKQILEIQTSKPLTEMEETGFYQMLLTLKKHEVISNSDIIEEFLKKYENYKKPVSNQLNAPTQSDSKSIMPSILVSAGTAKASSIGHFSGAHNSSVAAVSPLSAAHTAAKPVSVVPGTSK